VLPVVVALFFRDPNRRSPADPAFVLSPADGKVMHAGMARPDEAPPGRWQQVTIFLSPLDVHINRTPVAGRVTTVAHIAGSFLPAFRHESHRNEHSEIWINHDGVEVVARQVVGAMARRVVCRVRPGDELGPGERIGLMKFGSRMDVFVPETAEVLVKRGDQVRGGETVIARLGAAKS
jgi:phosphatidylserine decarboxylase